MGHVEYDAYGLLWKIENELILVIEKNTGIYGLSFELPFSEGGKQLAYCHSGERSSRKEHQNRSDSHCLQTSIRLTYNHDMRKMLALFVLSVPTALAQIPDWLNVFLFPPELKAYLDLSDDQVARIRQLNSQLDTFQASKGHRQVQVHIEIGQETAKETLDPMALGIRYLELEVIRREIEAERKRTASEVQTVLNPAQKTKLATLQEALRSSSTACAAVHQNLITMPAPNRLPNHLIPPTRWFDPTSISSSAALLLGTPATLCPSNPAVVFRTGDFRDFLPAPFPPQQ